MKTRFTLLYILTLLLSVFSVQTSMAQVTQNALYIFRNDGGFNAFFYGDIDRIEYSKIDTLGIEHDDYVVQEVYALDTLYRIPVSAIDSVSFVTPENKVKDDVFCPDKSITDYIIASDSVWWILLSPDTPTQLIPKEGDKLLIEEPCDLIPLGFGGRVAVSVQEEDGWLVATAPTPLTDIYDRLIVNIAAATPAAQSRHKASRLNRIFDGTYTLEVPETPLNLISFPLELTFDKSVIHTPEGKPISVSANLTGTLKGSLDVDMTYRSHLFIDPLSGFQYDQKTKMNGKFNAEASLAGSITTRLDIGWPLTKYEFGGAEFSVGAGLYVEGVLSGYEIKASYTLAGALASHAYMNQDDVKSLVGSVGSSPNVNLSGEITENKLEYENNLPFLKEGPSQIPNTITISIGAAVKAESKIGQAIEKAKEELPERLLKFMEKYAFGEKKDSVGFNIEMGIDLGTKLEVKAPWDLLWRETPLLETQPSYTQLDKEASASGSLYFKAGANINMGPWKLARPFEKSISTDPLGLVPDISDLRVATDKEANPMLPYRKHFFAPIKRDLMMGVDIGFLVVNEDKEEVVHNTDLGWFRTSLFDKGLKSFKNGGYNMYFNIDPGKGDSVKYTAYPLVKLITGRELIAPVEYEFKIEPAGFDIAQRDLAVSIMGGYMRDEYIGPYEMEVIPNMENVEVKSECDWIHDVTFLNHLNQLSFYWDDLPDDLKMRRGIIRLLGLSQKGEELVEDSIVVTQTRSYLEIDPREMEFDESGGSKQATIIDTNLQDLRVICYQDFVHASLNGKIITVNVDPNTGESRETKVHVQGRGRDGLIYEDLISVSQAGKDEDPSDPTPSDGPFKYINFSTQCMVQYIDEESESDTIVQVMPAFSFAPDNYTKFEKKRDGNIIHFVVEGYKEYAAHETKTRATLTFDIDKKEEKVKNLAFTLDTESTVKIFMVVGRTTTTMNGHYSMTLADFPLKTNSATWMSTTDFSVAEGLKFTSFSGTADLFTVYEDLLNGDHIDPLSQHMDYIPIGDPSDMISLWINLNDEESDMAWPTEEVMQSLRSGGMPIYEGETPPSVEGTYLISPIAVVNDKTGEAAGDIPADMGLVIRLSSQGDGKITYNSYATIGGMADSSGDNITGLIKGNGNDFTICIPIDAEESMLISGEMQDGNIANFYFANTNNTIANRNLIIKDGDSSTSKTTWAPGADEARKRKGLRVR